MNANHIIFTLNVNEKIIFDLSYSLEEILPFDMTIVTFFSEYTVNLTKEAILPLLREFKAVLKSAFYEKSTFPNNSNQDIGYIWNKVLKKDTEEIALTLDETQKYWVGRNYMAWSTPGNIKPALATWIYNDTDGNIIFHITPELGNVFTISKKKFDIWMQSYKPFLIRTIPKDVAQTWLDQIDHALEIVESKLKK